MTNSPLVGTKGNAGEIGIGPGEEIGGLMLLESGGRLQIALSEATQRRLTVGWRLLPWLVAFAGLCVTVALLPGTQDRAAHPWLVVSGYLLVALPLILFARWKKQSLQQKFCRPVILDRAANRAIVGDKTLGPLTGVARLVTVVDKDYRALVASIAIEMQNGDRHVIAPRPLGYNTIYSTVGAERIAAFIGVPIEVKAEDFSSTA